MATNCLMLLTHARPLIGGALTVYDALASRARGQISVLTASIDYTTGLEVAGWRDFDAQAGYKIDRISEMRAKLLPQGVNVGGKLIATMQEYRLRHRVLAKTKQLIERDNIDVVCIGALDALGWIVEPLKKQTQAKVVIYVHGEEVSQTAYSAKGEQNRRNALQGADGVIAVSRFTRRTIAEKYGLEYENVTLQGNGVDLQRYSALVDESARARFDLPSGRFVFTCGRLVEHKGFDKLIEAWPAVAGLQPDVRLLIAGRGPCEEALQQRVTALGLSTSVQFLGWVDADKLQACYAHAEAFILPSRTLPDGNTEGFGLVFLEAAAMGTPSIAGRAGGTEDAVLEGETGLFVDGYKPEEISAAVNTLLSDDKLRNKLGTQAQAHARTQGWQEKTDEFMAYLSELVK